MTVRNRFQNWSASYSVPSSRLFRCRRQALALEISSYVLSCESLPHAVFTLWDRPLYNVCRTTSTAQFTTIVSHIFEILQEKQKTDLQTIFHQLRIKKCIKKDAEKLVEQSS